MRYIPKEISVYKEKKELVIGWKDGHVSRYPFGGLRSSCPCVHCQGGHSEMGKPMDAFKYLADTPESLHMTSIRASGNYALQINWNDGHSTGIYRFEYLRDGCPVEAGILDPAEESE